MSSFPVKRARQVKRRCELEDALGVTLFIRKTRSLALAPQAWTHQSAG
ncbi:hypothetical protein BN1221_03615c [Brenneria goodwinii]|uniref:Uncharacterized protein n=1 Tax=Brenneria goodwinii TaxID=1109412 RepID=A0A0G4JYT4_9GAMM|nr:hypothetical protein BN1221_03615c [Brenneria goodwinii]